MYLITKLEASISARDPARRKIKATADARVWRRPRTLSSVPQHSSNSELARNSNNAMLSSVIIAGGRVGLIADEDMVWIISCVSLACPCKLGVGRRYLWSSRYRATTELRLRFDALARECRSCPCARINVIDVSSPSSSLLSLVFRCSYWIHLSLMKLAPPTQIMLDLFNNWVTWCQKLSHSQLQIL